MTGTVIQHYRVGGRLGGGAMGEVFEAEDLRLGRRVALKFVSRALADDPAIRHRLLTEARAASALRSPYIAVPYDIGEHDGRPFIAMEHVDGELVADRLRRGPLPPREAVRLAGQVAEALDEAHARGIVHRDIKSGNLMLTARGGAEEIKVLDFGLARVIETPWADTAPPLTQPGMVVGTLAYAAPEQVLGRPVDGRADLFSLGVVLYEMLTGRLPFDGATVAEVLDGLLHRTPPPPSALGAPVPPELDAIVLRALEKDPARRQQSARELAAALAEVAERLDGTAAARPGPPALDATEPVAVLTFANLTRDPADDWIGSGLAETITADLRSLFGLGVVSRVRVAQALQALSARDLAAAGDRLAVELGRRLGAAWIVTGAYQRVGDQLRITAHFVDVRTGALVRTVKVDGRVDQIFALQDRIVFELTRGLDVRLGPEQVAAVARVETRSIAAYECYSRGMMNLRLGTLDSLDRAIVLLERATTLDPQYVAAWTGLAAAYSLKGEFLRLPELCERAIEHARRALALDPRHATAHGRLGDALLNLGRVDEAIAALEHALAIEPDNVFTLGVLARALWIGQGRIEEALERFERVVALNPEAGYAYLQMALLYSLRGRYDRAEAAARRAVDLQERLLSGHEGLQLVGARARLGYVFYLQGRYDEAVAEYERELAFLATSDHLLRDRTRIEVMQKLGAAWLRAGRPDEAARWFDQAVRAFDERIAKGADDPYTRYYMACLHALRGEEAEAIAHLERSIAEGGPVQRVRAARDPDLEAIRQAPAVQALLAA